MGLFFLLAGAGMVALVWHAYNRGQADALQDHRDVLLRRGDTILLGRSTYKVTGRDRTVEGHAILALHELRRDMSPA